MANLAINDVHTFSSLLDDGVKQCKDQSSILSLWENIQRPKFLATRLRTYRHIEMYASRSRYLYKYLWKIAPLHVQGYFGSIFAYGYDVFDPNKVQTSFKVPGVIGISHVDPMVDFVSRQLKKVGVLSAMGFFF